MNNIIKYKEIESKIILIRDQKVLIDKDVAEIYGVETKRINEAVKNNIDKVRKNACCSKNLHGKRTLYDSYHYDKHSGR